MNVFWTPEAEQDRADIWDYIAADNPRAAARLDKRFSDAAAKLATHPKIGRPGKIPGTRELIPHKNYRLVYEIDEQTVWVLALYMLLANGRRFATSPILTAPFPWLPICSSALPRAPAPQMRTHCRLAA